MRKIIQTRSEAEGAAEPKPTAYRGLVQQGLTGIRVVGRRMQKQKRVEQGRK